MSVIEYDTIKAFVTRAWSAGEPNRVIFGAEKYRYQSLFTPHSSRIKVILRN